MRSKLLALLVVPAFYAARTQAETITYITSINASGSIAPDSYSRPTFTFTNQLVSVTLIGEHRQRLSRSSKQHSLLSTRRSL